MLVKIFRGLFVLTAILFLISCQSEWKTFSTPEGILTVSVPKDPISQQQPAGDLMMTLYKVETSDVYYLFSVLEIPENRIMGRSADKMLDDARNGAVANSGGTLVKEENLTKEGSPGRSIIVRAPDSSGMAFANLFILNKRTLVILTAITRGSDPTPPADVIRFFDSVKLKQSNTD